MQLSKRLKQVADLIPNGARIIDIACDHGLLGIYLLSTKKAKKVLLTDISYNALNSARKNALKHQVKPTFLVTDGLTDINYQAYDTIVIAGLGSEQIIKIIDGHKLTQQLILVTHSNPYQLRKYMQDHNFKQIQEILVYENDKYYFVMEYHVGMTKYSFKQLFLGISYQNKDQPNYHPYLVKLLKKYQLINQQLPFKYLTKKIYYSYLISIIKKAL